MGSFLSGKSTDTCRCSNAAVRDNSLATRVLCAGPPKLKAQIQSEQGLPYEICLALAAVIDLRETVFDVASTPEGRGAFRHPVCNRPKVCGWGGKNTASLPIR